jgi:predicted Zn finger-like uncharacterized protein
MYSQCPECLTRFRVTAAALRAAHGTVRCGRCGSAFDALQRLTDVVPDEGTPEFAPALGSTAHSGASGPAATDADDGGEVSEFHFSADDIEQVFVDARDWTNRYPTSDARVAAPQPANDAGEPGAPRDTGDVADTAAAPPAGGAPVVLVHEPDAIEDITLEGERIVIDGLPELDDDLRAIVPTAADPAGEDETTKTTAPASATPEPAEAAVPPAPIVPFRLRVRDADVDETLAVDAAEERERGTRPSLAWGVGALLLALVLAAQLAHHYRRDLARDARLGPPVRSVYARLGRPLPPNWDLAAFEVRQWGASEAARSGAGALTVRASLRNGAAFAQPLPLLRLELEDRFGGTVARRDFAPGEYLKDDARASRLLAPGAEAEAELDVVEAGTDAVGYRLDVCLREDASGEVRCTRSADEGSTPL